MNSVVLFAMLMLICGFLLGDCIADKEWTSAGVVFAGLLIEFAVLLRYVFRVEV